jgi:hypothetical protein
MHSRSICYVQKLNSSDSIIIILLNAAENKIKISTAEIPKSPWWEVIHVSKAAAANFGVAVRVVRCLSGDSNEMACLKRTYAVEAIGTHYEDGLIDNLDSMSLELIGGSIAALQELLDARLNSIRSQLINYEPWIDREFHNRMESFVCSAISNVKTQSIMWTQLRCWPRAYVYEIEADGNRYIFKTCRPAYTVEPMLTQYLSKKYPNLIADVIAVEDNEDFLLSAAFVGREAAAGDIKSFEAAAHGLAKIQVAEAKEVSKLVSLGLVIQDYHLLKNSILALLNDHSALTVGENGGLTNEELNKFKGAKKLITSAVSRLQTIGVPLSLEHGDFRAANILCNDSHSCCIIDWSEAVISHPFFSLAQLLDEEDHAQDPFSANQIKNQIILAYFSPWLNAGFTRDHLKETLDLARLLMPIIRAIERRERLIPNLADAKTWSFSVAYWVRRFLLRLASHDPA